MRINWNIPNTCTRQDTHANLTEQALQQSQDCLLINHVTTDPRVQPEQPLEHWRGFWRLARLEPQNVPRTALAAEISLAEGGNLLRVTYRFSTEMHGFQPDPAGWANSGWHRSRLDPARRAHVERFQNWAQQARPIMRAGFMRGSISPLPPFR